MGIKRRHRRQAALTAVKLIHTLVWFSIESCMVYVLWSGFRGRSDRRAAIAAGVVAGETLVFAANGFRCPLTPVAERLGAKSGSVTDIYLPRWLAHNLPHPRPTHRGCDTPPRTKSPRDKASSGRALGCATPWPIDTSRS
jgi:hypothetical protein